MLSFFPKYFLADNPGNVVHYKRILGNAINNRFFKEERRNPNKSFVNIRILLSMRIFKIFSPINAENCGTLSHNLKLQHIKK